MKKHTRGPWEVFTGEEDGVEVIDTYHRTVAYIRQGLDTEANAKLIAAAPDTLAVLEKLKSEVHEGYVTPDTLSEAADIIEKVRRRWEWEGGR